MTSLELYRILIPGHSAVADATIDLWLVLAARAHTASAWGQVYAEAMVFYAAHHVEGLAGSSGTGGSAGAVGAVISQKDGDLSRSYAGPVSVSGSSASAEDGLTTTRYGQAYLTLRNKRAAAFPMIVVQT